MRRLSRIAIVDHLRHVWDSVVAIDPVSLPVPIRRAVEIGFDMHLIRIQTVSWTAFIVSQKRSVRIHHHWCGAIAAAAVDFISFM